MKIPFEPSPTYLVVTLNRSLTCCKHLWKTAAKVIARCNLLKTLATINWGVDFNTLRTSAVSPCYSVAEYCSPVWSGSVHCIKLDVSLNECMGLISGCIKSTPTEILPIFSGIETSDLRRDKQLLNLYNRSKALSHPMHVMFSPDYHYNHRLKLHNPVSIRTSGIFNRINNIDYIESSGTWVEVAWSNRWETSNQYLRTFIHLPSKHPPGHELKHAHWVLLNRLRSGHGRYAAFMKKISLSESELCICGSIQTPGHVLICSTFRIRGNIGTVDNDFKDWLNDNTLLTL